MSCEVKTFAKVENLKEVQEYFGFSHDNWLNSVNYSISPTLETIAFGHGNKLIFMTSQWLATYHSLPTYCIRYKGELENENEVITSIICLPMFGNITNTGADWTCIAIGLSSGLVLFYTDSGLQIFSQRFHSENVVFLKAQSGSRLLDEIHIGYISCVCILEGNHLFPVLKGMKQIKIKKSKNMQVPDTVPCRKWEYKSGTGGIINDAVVVRTQEVCTLDHYLEQSLEKGFSAKCRSAPSQNSLVVAVGTEPYIGFFYAKEGFVATDFTDVAKAVANKVISVLPGWLFKSTNTNNNQQNDAQIESPTQPPEPINCRFGICDIKRQGLNIWLAPGNELAVISDNLQRIILIDLLRGIAIKMWKGYRDAQCGFLSIKEKSLKSSDKSRKRKSLFLIIYAPRKSCLEIWALQNGPKIAAFTVSKNGQLCYNSHNLMAVSSSTKPKVFSNPCIFIDPSDETLKEFLIPFHCALSESNSKTAKDIHLLRRLKVFLRSDAKDDDIISEVENLCSSLQTNELRLQCLEILIKNKKLKPEILLIAVKTLEKFTLGTIEENMPLYDEDTMETLSLDDNNTNSLPILLKNYEYLTEFYLRIKSFYPHNDEENVKTNYAKLNLNEADLETINSLLDNGKIQKIGFVNTSKVKFEDNKHNGDFIEFLNVFIVESPNIRLNPKKQELYGFIGSNLFSKFLEHGHHLNCYIQSIEETSIPKEDLLSLLLYYWLERPFNYTKCEEVIEDMIRFGIAIEIICYKTTDIKYDYNTISSWWQNIRELLLESPSAARSLLAALVCKKIAFSMQKIDKLPDEGECDEVGEEVWEQVSQEVAQWELLIGKFDDISVLEAILSVPVVNTNPALPCIEYEKPNCSLKVILCSGKGIVSELTAKWLISSRIDPSHIIETNLLCSNLNSNKNSEEKDANNTNEDDSDDLHPDTVSILNNLKILKKHFPFSLESGVLLCHMTWNFMLHWSKCVSKLEYFKAALDCLDSFNEKDYALKHGLACMIWNSHLKITLEAVKKLIQKVGKLPKEKLCQQDIGMSMLSIPEFLDNCSEFLKHLQNSLEHEKRELKFEEILQDNQIPLSFLALQQNHAISEILNLHIELCEVLYFISFFSLQVQKPITQLFDPISNETLFVEINRELKYSLTIPDFVLQQRRDDFLCQVVSASTDLIRDSSEGIYVKKHSNFINRIKQLADKWDIDQKSMMKRQVVEVYAHGWDSYGEELLQYIADKESIGPLLLEIAGRRLNLYSSNSQSIFCHVASIGPQLLNYLDNLKNHTNNIEITEESPENIDLKALTILAAHVFKCFSTSESKYVHIAGLLYDACSLLTTLQVKK